MHSEIPLCEERTTFKGEKGVSFPLCNILTSYCGRRIEGKKEGSQIKLMTDRSIDGWIDI